MTVNEIIEEVIGEICDSYCRFPKEWEGDFEKMLEEVCSNCPLNRL